MKTPRLSISLKERRKEEVPLDALLDQALDVLNPTGRSRGFRASHLAQQALRAVCEAVVADNCLTLPVQIHRPYKRERPAPKPTGTPNKIIAVKFG